MALSPEAAAIVAQLELKPHPEGGHYTFWDYFGSWERNNGIRIDHLLLSPQALDRLKSVGIDKEVRGASEKPSDHVPVWVDLAI